MKLWKKNLILLALVVIITVVPIVFVNGKFGGADNAATDIIKELNKDYKPWANAPFQPPSSEVEGMLFAVQAAIGGGIIGFGFGRLSAKSKVSNSKDGN